MLKRAFDFLAAAGGLVILSPLLGYVAWRIRREDPGPAFFLQERVGRDGKSFLCCKFRTMRVDAEAMLAAWKATGHPLWHEYVASNFKLKDDPRVTPIGRWLRRTSVDELPQLWNVLRGEMSLVGPRPLLARELPDYGEEAFGHYKSVLPGITGLWQVSGRSETTFADRARLDVAYCAKRSFAADFRLLLRTVAVLTKRRGAY